MYYDNYIIYCIILVNQSQVEYITYFPFQSIDLGLTVSIPYMGCVDLCSIPEGENNLLQGKRLKYIFVDGLSIIRIIHFIRIILQVDALLKTLEQHRSAQHKGHFSLFNCLVIRHTKYKGVQRVYCNPFPAKPFHGSHRMDLVMIRPPGIDNGAFVVSPDSVWYASVLLLFSASAMTDTGSKTLECALVSTLETYDDPDNGNIYIIAIIHIMHIIMVLAIMTLMHVIAIMLIIACSSVHDGWNLSALGWFMSLTTRNLSCTSFPFRVSSANFLWFPLVPVGDTGTIQYHPRNTFSGAPSDRRMGAGDGCKMWFVNSWALGWSRDM
jgi:hypothetical protein